MIVLIVFVLQIYSFILLGRTLLSWFPDVDRQNPIVQALYDLTEPVLRPVRQMFPPQGGVDFSTLIVLVGISLLTMVLQNFG